MLICKMHFCHCPLLPAANSHVFRFSTRWREARTHRYPCHLGKNKRKRCAHLPVSLYLSVSIMFQLTPSEKVGCPGSSHSFISIGQKHSYRITAGSASFLWMADVFLSYCISYFVENHFRRSLNPKDRPKPFWLQ